MVYGISSNMIENFANFNENYEDIPSPTNKLTDADLNSCAELISNKLQECQSSRNSGQGGSSGPTTDNNRVTPEATTETTQSDDNTNRTDMSGTSSNVTSGSSGDRGSNEGVNNNSETDDNKNDEQQDLTVSPTESVDETNPFIDVEEEFGDHESPVYEGFTNSDFNASSLVRGRNLHNLLKALLIALVLCSLNHKDVSRMVVEPLVRLTHNRMGRTTMVCVLIFLVAYLVIALL
jgi:hypothetical protein